MRLGPFFIPLALAWFAVAPTARPVTPAPDGGYPGNNTAEGDNALFSLTTGFGDTAIGFQALYSNTTGNTNTAIGTNALFSNTTDIGNVGVACDANKIRIGKVRTQNGTFVAGIYGVGVTGTAVVVSSTGQLGVAPSSARFKEEIKPMGNASEGILALKPVTFRYKRDIDRDSIPQFGLVAEEVEKINPDLVVRDADGKIYTVRYEAVNAMLLNEFSKNIGSCRRRERHSHGSGKSSRRPSHNSRSKLRRLPQW